MNPPTDADYVATSNVNSSAASARESVFEPEVA